MTGSEIKPPPSSHRGYGAAAPEPPLGRDRSIYVEMQLRPIDPILHPDSKGKSKEHDMFKRIRRIRRVTRSRSWSWTGTRPFSRQKGARHGQAHSPGFAASLATTEIGNPNKTAR